MFGYTSHFLFLIIERHTKCKNSYAKSRYIPCVIKDTCINFIFLNFKNLKNIFMISKGMFGNRF